MNFIRGKHFIFALNCILFSKDTTFLREYSYTPSKFDTRETAREISINEAKTILLEEVGVFAAGCRVALGQYAPIQPLYPMVGSRVPRPAAVSRLRAKQ